MITDNEKFIEIQAILVSSNINTRDCAKINDLIIELSKENQELKRNCNIGYENLNFYREENQELKEDISFCLHSIKQEMEMSIDSRTRNEMTSCYEILKRWNK